MKPLLLIILAILIHLLIKLFWDTNYDFTLYDKLQAELESVPNAKLLYEQIVSQEKIGATWFSATIAIVMFTWVFLYSHSLQSAGIKTFVTWWLFWLANDVLKELSHLTGFLSFFFLDPTRKYLSEYIIFAISTGYVIYRLKRSK